MTRIVSIAILTFRESVRTKLVLALAAVIALLVGGLPLLVKGDGTIVGVARMTLLYPLAAVFVFLAATAPWTAAAALASDVKGRTLQLVRVKPVRMWQLWVGKWLGLLFLNALLLAFAFAGVYIRLASTGALAADDIRLAKRHIPPILPSLEKQIDDMEANVAATYPEGMSAQERRELRATLRRQLPYASASLPPGGTWRWRFAPDRLPAAGERVWLRLKFQTDALSQKQPVARLLLQAEGADGSVTDTADITDFSARSFDIALPMPVLDGAQKLELVIRNMADKDAPSIIIQPRQGIFLLVPVGGLELNMLRAYVVLLSLLALLLALGLSFGAFFTLPVAVFATTCLIISVIASSYAMSDPDILDRDALASEPPLRRFQFRLSATVTQSIAAASAPALKPAPLAHISSSEWVPSDEILHALIGNGLVLPALLALISSLYLARKELPE